MVGQASKTAKGARHSLPVEQVVVKMAPTKPLSFKSMTTRESTYHSRVKTINATQRQRIAEKKLEQMEKRLTSKF